MLQAHTSTNLQLFKRDSTLQKTPSSKVAQVKHSLKASF
jgi:hypothetical protein